MKVFIQRLLKNQFFLYRTDLTLLPLPCLIQSHRYKYQDF